MISDEMKIVQFSSIAYLALEETAGQSPKGQALLILLWSFAECGFRKALRLKAQGVYSGK